jgi:hypothetical protein
MNMGPDILSGSVFINVLTNMKANSTRICCRQ